MTTGKVKSRYSGKFIAGAVMISLIIIAMVLYAAFGKTSVTLTEDEVRENLENNLPITVKGRKFLQDYTITISDLSFDFMKDGNIGLEVSPLIELKQGTATTTVTAVGEPELIGSAFYFKTDDFSFESFELDDTAKDSASTAGTILNNTLKKIGVKDVLKGTNIELGTKSSNDAVITFLKDKSEVTIISILQNYPVYKIEGGLGFAIAMGIDKTIVTDNDITIHFSIFKFTGMALLYLLAGIAAIGFVLTAPFWAVGLLGISSAIG